MSQSLSIKKIYINHLKTKRPLRYFTDQTTEATISKFGSGVLYSIRIKIGIIKSVLIKNLIKKKLKLFFSIRFVFETFVSF